MENILYKPPGKIINTWSKLSRVITAGLAIRIALLTIILLLGQYNVLTPFFVSDDITYDGLAKAYLNCASSAIDRAGFRYIGAQGYLSTFWPWVMCTSAYIFNTSNAGRFINVILSVLCIKKTYDLTYNLCQNADTSLFAAKIFAYMPITIVTCCFPIKDIFLTFSVLYTFNLLIKFQAGRSIQFGEIIVEGLLIWATYFTRGGVVQILLLFSMLFFIQHYIKSKNHIALIICAITCVVALYFLWNSIMGSFQTKINDYFNYARVDSAISSIRIDSLKQMYKLPLAYFFATLQPLKTNYFSATTQSFWYSLLEYLNVSIFPIAIGNIMYFFCKKKNMLFWISTLVMFCTVIILSFGIFRHYLFLLPVEIINFTLFKEQCGKRWNVLIFIFALVTFLFLLVYSLF